MRSWDALLNFCPYLGSFLMKQASPAQAGGSGRSGSHRRSPLFSQLVATLDRGVTDAQANVLQCVEVKPGLWAGQLDLPFAVDKTLVFEWRKDAASIVEPLTPESR